MIPPPLIAIASEKRSGLLPEIPTFAETATLDQMNAEIALWGPIVKAANIKGE